MIDKVDYAVQIGKEKQNEKVDVEGWQAFQEACLDPIYHLADADVKDATRRITSEKTKAKKAATQQEQHADSDDESEPGAPEDQD